MFLLLDVESKTLEGVKDELVLDKTGQYHLENTTLDFQKLSDKEVLRITGPLGADLTVKVRAEIYQFKCLKAALIYFHANGFNLLCCLPNSLV